MEQKSRTEYSAKNATVTLVSRLLGIVMGYLLRVVFTHTLSESYVGANGLFLDIINVLSLSEMGIGTAITYALYRPIADGDIEKQKSLMKLYRKLYRYVAAIVSLLGIALIPFLHVLIKDYEQVDHLMLIYVLYLVNTICSYLLIYKKTLMDAHQLLYIGTLYQTLSWVVKDILQAVVLITRHDFLAFLYINIGTTVLCNLLISRHADRLYPFLKDTDAVYPDKKERTWIYTNIRAMLMHKVGAVIVNNTDNLLLSAFIGLSSAGSYSNYYLVIGSIRQLMNQVYQGITASVGNLGVTEEEGHIRGVFEAVFFLGQWMYGFGVISLYELLNPFVAISFGKSFLFPQTVVLILCLNFYVNGIRNAALTFRDAMGLFYYDRYKAIVEAVCNLLLSLVFVYIWGVAGVFLGTLLSMLLTSVWVEPYVLYHYGFHQSSGSYFARLFVYSGVGGVIWLLTDVSCRYLAPLEDGSVVICFAKRFILCMLLPNLLFFLVYCRTKEFVFIKERAFGLLARMGKKGRE